MKEKQQNNKKKTFHSMQFHMDLLSFPLRFIYWKPNSKKKYKEHVSLSKLRSDQLFRIEFSLIVPFADN